MRMKSLVFWKSSGYDGRGYFMLRRNSDKEDLEEEIVADMLSYLDAPPVLQLFSLLLCHKMGFADRNSVR